MLTHRNVLFIFGILGFMVSGCAKDETTEKPIPTLTKHLEPYLTKSPTAVQNLATATKIENKTPDEDLIPTATPFVYEVVENDTLTGIAFRHSIPLEDLIAANPGIDPNFLTIGLTLTIPMDGIVSAEIPTSTPIPLGIKKPACYKLGDGTLQCMAVVENDQVFPVENVSVMISLQLPGNNKPNSEITIPPLNIIPAGRKAAVSASFTLPDVDDYEVQASLLSVIPVTSDDQRYLQTKLENLDTKVSLDGRQATVTGSIAILPEQPDARAVWVTVFAYDTQNKIVGIRKWVADDQLIGDLVDFEIVVYSLGGAIDHVEILSETRP